MAIGLSLTPRGYNVDTTGKSYTLDPDPLMRAQEKNFALQRESQRGIMDVAKRGFDFMEYLGARQQLGRVKAQLGELNPNDPAFAQRYSDIILGNPLAFEHASTGPLAKMALAPVTAMATSAIEQKYKLEQIAALGQNALAVAGVRGSSSETNALIRALYGGSGGRAEAKPDAWIPFAAGGSGGGATTDTGAAPPVANAPAAAGSIYSLVGTDVTDTPTSTGTATGAPDGSLFPTPANAAPPFSPDGAAPVGLLPDLPPPEADVLQTPTTGQYVPRGPFAPAALAPIGQPDFSNINAPPRDASLVTATPAEMAGGAVEATASPVAQAPPEVLAAARARGALVPIADARGDLWIPTEIGADMKLVRYLPAEKGPERKGYDQIPSELYPNGVAKAYEYKPEIKASATEIAKFTDDLKVILDADPDMQRLEMRRDAAKTAYDTALLKFKAIPTDAKGEGTTFYDKKQALLPDLEKLAAEANKLSGDYTRYRASRLGEVARREDPKLAEMMHRDMQVKAEEQMRKKNEEFAAPLLRQHLGMRPEGEEITATPPPQEEPGAELDLGQQLEATNPDLEPNRQKWTDEKVYALEELKDLASKMKVSRESILNAIQSGNFNAINDMIAAAQKRGVDSPLLTKRMTSTVAGPTAAGGGAGFALGWNKSKKLGQSYEDILRFAIQDPNALGKAGLRLSGLEGKKMVSPINRAGRVSIVP